MEETCACGSPLARPPEEPPRGAPQRSPPEEPPRGARVHTEAGRGCATRWMGAHQQSDRPGTRAGERRRVPCFGTACRGGRRWEPMGRPAQQSRRRSRGAARCMHACTCTCGERRGQVRERRWMIHSHVRFMRAMQACSMHISRRRCHKSSRQGTATRDESRSICERGW